MSNLDRARFSGRIIVLSTVIARRAEKQTLRHAVSVMAYRRKVSSCCFAARDIEKHEHDTSQCHATNLSTSLHDPRHQLNLRDTTCFRTKNLHD